MKRDVSMSKKTIAVLCLLTGVAVGVLLGQNRSAQATERSSKHTSYEVGTGFEVEDYKKIHVLITRDVEGTIALNEEQLRTKVELRLRSLGLTPTKTKSAGQGYLALHIIERDGVGQIVTGYYRFLDYSVGGKSYIGKFSVPDSTVLYFDAQMTTKELYDSQLEPTLDLFLKFYLEANERK